MNKLIRLFIISILTIGLPTSLFSQKIYRIYDHTEDFDNRCRLTLFDGTYWTTIRNQVGPFPETWQEFHEVAVMIVNFNSSSFLLKNMVLEETLPVTLTNVANPLNTFERTTITVLSNNSITLSDGRIYLTRYNPNWMPGDQIIVCSQDGSRIGDYLFNHTRKSTAIVNNAEWLNKAHYKIKEVDPQWGDMISLENGAVLQICNEDLYGKWSEGDSIILLSNHEKTYFGDHHFYHYTLINMRTGTQVLCYILAADFAQPPTIDDISGDGKLHLSNGDVFQMEMSDMETLSSWNDSDRVIIGVNHGEKNEQYPYLLINVDQSLSGPNREPAPIFISE